MSEPSAAPQPPPPPSPDGASHVRDILETVVPAVLPLVRLLPPPEGTMLTPPESPNEPRRTWILIDIWQQMRLAVKMYFDPRYRVSRMGQFAIPVFAALLVLNYFFFTMWWPVPVVSQIAERLIDVILSVIAYRVLVRELERYRTVLDYLARYVPRQQ